jgi:hypothetical protein
VLLLVLGGGCAWQASRDASKIERLEAKVAEHKEARKQAARDLSAAADRFRAISAATERERKLAAEAADANAKAVKVAEERSRQFLAERDAFERTLRDAKKRSPSCRAQLEAPLCVPLE